MEDDKQYKATNGEGQSDEAAHNEPRLHASNFTPSESRTTNIPPRLPAGFSYTSPDAATSEAAEAAADEPKLDANAGVEPTPEIMEAHPDLPDDDDTLRSEPTIVHRPRPKHKRSHHTSSRLRTWCKRYWVWSLLILIVIATAATYQLWTPLLSGFGHADEPAPVIAADTLPQQKPVVQPDTTVNVLTHEDSLRIQDSVRHARWVYWQRRKQREQQAAQEATQTEEPTTADEATTTSPTVPHTNHTTHKDTL